MEYSYIIATVLIEDSDGNILMLTTKKIGAWSLPGGKVEPGEQPRQAAIRETREETQLDVQITSLAGYREFFWESDNAYWTELIYKAEIKNGTPTIAEPDKITALEWRPKTDLPEDAHLS